VVANCNKVCADDVVRNRIILQSILRITPDHNPSARTLQRAVETCFPGCDQEWAALQGWTLKKLLSYLRRSH
jgi:hypothetical protein